jgi:hypothetical protein
MPSGFLRYSQRRFSTVAARIKVVAKIKRRSPDFMMRFNVRTEPWRVKQASSQEIQFL